MDCHSKVSEILVMFEKTYLLSNHSQDFISFVLDLLNRAYSSKVAFHRDIILALAEKINLELKSFAETQENYNPDVNLVVQFLKNAKKFDTELSTYFPTEIHESVQRSIIKSRQEHLTSDFIDANFKELAKSNDVDLTRYVSEFESLRGGELACLRSYLQDDVITSEINSFLLDTFFRKKINTILGESVQDLILSGEASVTN